MRLCNGGHEKNQHHFVLKYIMKPFYMRFCCGFDENFQHHFVINIGYCITQRFYMKLCNGFYEKNQHHFVIKKVSLLIVMNTFIR